MLLWPQIPGYTVYSIHTAVSASGWTQCFLHASLLHWAQDNRQANPWTNYRFILTHNFLIHLCFFFPTIAAPAHCTFDYVHMDVCIMNMFWERIHIQYGRFVFKVNGSQKVLYLSLQTKGDGTAAHFFLFLWRFRRPQDIPPSSSSSSSCWLGRLRPHLWAHIIHGRQNSLRRFGIKYQFNFRRKTIREHIIYHLSPDVDAASSFCFTTPYLLACMQYQRSDAFTQGLALSVDVCVALRFGMRIFFFGIFLIMALLSEHLALTHRVDLKSDAEEHSMGIWFASAIDSQLL